MPHRAAAVAAAVLLCLLAALAGCQPVDELDEQVGGPVPAETDGAEEPLGSPVEPMPASLDELLAETGEEARRWQPGARPAEITVELDQSGAWQRASVTFIAAGAEQLLTLTVDAEGLSSERVSLAGLELSPVSAAGLEALPPLPAEAQAPDALAEAAAPILEDCGLRAGPARAVLYTTGAPVAWDGEAWTAPPQWRATVRVDDGGAVLDPATAEPTEPRCLRDDDAGAQ